MQHIHEVIKETDTPSWVRSVPHNFGESQAGTLKADEWHTMAMLFLLLSLISLWGEGVVHESNCMMAYQAYILDWLSSLRVILPAANFHPNGHMALHIYDYLKLFGPVHLWWCFPFECLIGHLQCIPTNPIFGVSFLLLHA
ncbi:hypothetical protein ID866_13256 [Astraeus odoratus]|nr:hypothetical protein ID866_13256 [Astraeus odoratus]